MINRWAIGIILSLSLVAGFAFGFKKYLSTPMTTPEIPRLLKEIHTDKTDAADSPQDTIEFTDGSRLVDIGYDVTLLGTISLSNATPVYLFKSFSCRGCEPEINLTVYSSQTGERQIVPYPGQHLLVATDQPRETADFSVSAVFGDCAGGPKLFLSKKSREVDSDGMTIQSSDIWSHQTTLMSFQPDGRVQISGDVLDGAPEIQRLTTEGCKVIDPEDRFNYL